jgi:hypothetical protein
VGQVDLAGRVVAGRLTEGVASAGKEFGEASTGSKDPEPLSGC